MKLYGTPLSNNVFRPLLVARHLDLPLEVVTVDLTKGEHKTQEYRRLNPHGRIPVLEHDGYALWESLAIMQYLAAQKPSELWPEDARARATITSWQAWSVAHLVRGVGPIQFQRLFKRMFGMGDPDEGLLAAALATLQQETAVLEDRFADTSSGWLVGDSLTLADLDVAGQFLHAEAAEMPLPPKTAAWLDRVRALPAWERARQG